MSTTGFGWFLIVLSLFFLSVQALHDLLPDCWIVSELIHNYQWRYPGAASWQYWATGAGFFFIGLRCVLLSKRSKESNGHATEFEK